MRYHLLAQHSTASHALVIGGGLGGLLAARVLLDHFRQVTLIDQPAPPAHPLLLLRGQQILERLFPGICAELLAASAPLVDWAADCPVLYPSGWGLRFQSGLAARLATTDLLLAIARRRLLEYAGERARLCDEQPVGLLREPGQPYIKGVRCASGAALAANLVMAASGSPTRLGDWLAALGYPPPAENRIATGLHYAAALFNQPVTPSADWKALLLLPQPGKAPRGGLLYPVEGRRWLVTLFGWGIDCPPLDADGFARYARSLRSPALADALAGLDTPQALDSQYDIVLAHRRYDRLANWPHNLIVAGDMLYDYGPLAAHSSAALAVLHLSETLTEQRRNHRDGSLHGLAGRYFARLAQANRLTWPLAAAQAYYWQGIAAPGYALPALQAHTARLMAAAPRRMALLQTLLESAHHVASGARLFHPLLLARLLRLSASPDPVALYPPLFQPATSRKTITQEMAAAVRSAD